MLQERQWTSLLRRTTRHLPSRDTVALLCYHVSSLTLCPIAFTWLMQDRLQPAPVRHLLPPGHLSNLAYRIRVFGEKWPNI
jgi:hypothetical protein